jgi:hypothetical protein
MRDGVEVFKLTRKEESEEKTVLGKSPKAGQMAVMQSAASRVFTNMYVSFDLSEEEVLMIVQH